ncbi:hypothetical protein HNY73_004330 [Argiope bruennichi]|uniref:Uncharacterized protein n=1 Tax=Argiope bruennichi TaxID=94029 RepID=A0A8T0FNL8_ARGBR|nr:hypothetical protein HNY73_004330 [Argiope bruennichi]
MYFVLYATAVFFVFGRLCGKVEDLIEQRDAAVGHFDYWDLFGVGGHCTYRRRKCESEEGRDTNKQRLLISCTAGGDLAILHCSQIMQILCCFRGSTARWKLIAQESLFHSPKWQCVEGILAGESKERVRMISLILRSRGVNEICASTGESINWEICLPKEVNKGKNIRADVEKRTKMDFIVLSMIIALTRIMVGAEF